MYLIEVKDVVAGYGGAPILNGVNIAIEQSDIGVIVGPNGAGKSTTLKAIFGLLKVTNGAISFAGEEITNSLPDKLVPRGLSFVPQEKNVFTSMTVEVNLEMGAFTRKDDFTTTIDWVYDMFPVLKEKRRQPAGELSGGQKKLLELGRTMMVDAKVVLLDEVAAGVNRTLLQDLAANIERMNQELGYTFFVIEHDMDLIGRLCDPVIVMAQGEVIAQGPMSEIRANPEIIEAYFGTPVEAAE